VYPSFGANGPAQLSAMPSVHVAWAVIIGTTIVMVARSPWRWLALAHPIITTLVVVATGNHYWLDGIVGAMIFVMAFWFERATRTVAGRLRLRIGPAADLQRAPSSPGSPGPTGAPDEAEEGVSVAATGN
jgi:hypothetical protein